MQYLCTRQLTAGGITYRPGELLPDGAVLPDRSRKLMKSGYIADLNQSSQYSKKETVNVKAPVTILSGTDGDKELLFSTEELNQAFFIMQMNVEDGVKAVADVTSENLLELLYAADSCKKVKEAAKKQADKLFQTAGSRKGDGV